jgi:hypothetical protein
MAAHERVVAVQNFARSRAQFELAGERGRSGGSRFQCFKNA